MRPVIYHSEQLQAWEHRWFSAGNSSYGLMQQAAWQMTQHIIAQLGMVIAREPVIGLWCGAGNNGGDGWLIAAYLKQAGFCVWVHEAVTPQSSDARSAQAFALSTGLKVYPQLEELPRADVHIDALFGIGLNRPLSGQYTNIIAQFNQQSGYKIAVDIPSGLQADTGRVFGTACRVDLSLTVLGYKAGLFTGQGAAYAGQVIYIELLPPDSFLKPLAYLDIHSPCLPRRSKTSHKGSNGHVLVIGGNENMGGAAILSAEAALAVGAGKVTLLTHSRHHGAVLSRCPNIMLLGFPAVEQFKPEWADHISQGMDCVAMGMGLGRDEWAKAIWQAFLPLLEQKNHIQKVVLDADALWHLADEQHIEPELHSHCYCTPHPGEAARLLGTNTVAVEQDRIAAIYALQRKYGGNWLLKGAGSLSLDQHSLTICGLGNPGMATAGMGDILAGMAAGLLAQLPDMALHEVVALHAAAGDLLAQAGERGIQATDMLGVLRQVVN
ncbi:NAD(P)H-hydrate dehydratase [Alkanindiges sp. WGS2144]|uniref:NAD(P)H-hydrate dehydratase n=1 Tax=Alkanindiges sp. WGS2144 TaxID=3366808 RepID=UPI00374FE0CB